MDRVEEGRERRYQMDRTPHHAQPVPLQDRLLGRIDGEKPGPTLVCVAAVHGNEPAGVTALERVFRAMRGRQGDVRGRLIGLLGNRLALRSRRRFVDTDLNRMWTAEGVAPPVDAAPPPSAESRELIELITCIDEAVNGSGGPIHVLDLHTTSALGGAFTTVSDTLRNRAFARRLQVPLILGLEELVEGTLLGFLAERGYVTVGFESGQHEEAQAIDRAEAAIWIAATAAGVLAPSATPELDAACRLLEAESRDLPSVLEMRHRHAVEPDDGFVMEEGYRNFQRVEVGELMGRDRAGQVRAPEGGRILMPLYQEQGNDGYFIVREFRPLWLEISTVLRRLGLSRIAHWLPGVRRLDGRPGALLIDRRIARWYPLKVFHLLGFRRLHDDGDRLVVIRQPSDD